MPLVRIVIPTYNRAALLVEALDSVLAQTFSDFEVVVADDGSTDNTAAVLQRFPGIRAVRLSHSGVASARNRAITEPGHYKYVAFLDADDLWLSQHLKASMGVLECQPEVALVFSSVEMLDPSRSWSEERLRRREERLSQFTRVAQRSSSGGLHILDTSACYQAMLQNEFCPPTSTVVIRRNAVLRSEWFDPNLEILEDCELYLSLLARGCTFACFDAVHARKRYYGDNLTGTKSLSSPIVLHRYCSALRYNKAKLRLCSTPEDRTRVSREIAKKAYIIAQCHVEQSNLRAARRAYLEALRYRFSYRVLKGLTCALLPTPMYFSARRVRDVLVMR